MKIPLQITFRNMPPSEAIENNVREKAARLDSLYDGIMSCRIIIEAPHRRHHKGKAYQVSIDMTVPTGKIVVNRAPKRLDTAKTPPGPEELENDLIESHEPSKHGAHEDLYVAIRDAFNAAARKLRDHARRRRGKVKVHEPAAVARVIKLFPIEDYGFLQAPDGREVYFHKNSVLARGFDRLEVGTEVFFAEEPGDKGPQASTVRVIRRQSSGKIGARDVR
jgi:cold shock CspA family protein/ribosome-associated translation inhibitor RaiA